MCSAFPNLCGLLVWRLLIHVDWLTGEFHFMWFVIIACADGLDQSARGLSRWAYAVSQHMRDCRGELHSMNCLPGWATIDSLAVGADYN